MRQTVVDYLTQLQNSICQSLISVDGKSFVEDAWQHTNGSGGGRTRVLSNGAVIEKGGVNFSHVHGDKLPPAATNKRPELAGKKFEAMGVSLVIHPHNPFAPTAHMNVRFFVAGADTEEPVWWFGGGFDMTPYYGFEEDAMHWHQTARAACQPFGEALYPRYKKWCDDYFHLPHRDEQRGIGGLFFDDLNDLAGPAKGSSVADGSPSADGSSTADGSPTVDGFPTVDGSPTADGSFEQSFAFMRSVGDHFIKAYLPILERRKDTPFEQAHRDWQLLRRGRYVEFNLVHDRGTLFGLQSGGRTESILMSMPPKVAWEYRAEPGVGTPEQDLLDHYLVAKDWLA